MRVIEVSGFSVKSLASVLLFVSSFGEADVGLFSEGAFLEGIHAFSIAPRK
jgi:hypothetical protein